MYMGFPFPQRRRMIFLKNANFLNLKQELRKKPK
jgi:hypothetical protein